MSHTSPCGKTPRGSFVYRQSLNNGVIIAQEEIIGKGCEIMACSKEMVCTAAEALGRLEQGNERYLAGAQPPAVTAAQRQSLVAEGQHPYACIVTCSDSRVPPEMIFCAGMGDIFVIRTAGNTISGSEMATIAYAGTHLQVPLVVVMGHTHCGAVEAALGDDDDEDVQHIVDGIRRMIGSEKDPRRSELKNAQAWAREIAASTVFAPHIERGGKAVVAALYDTESGEVTFY